jgi:hypothetical protein
LKPKEWMDLTPFLDIRMDGINAILIKVKTEKNLRELKKNLLE